MYSLLPKFTSATSYRSISLQKNKLASGQRQIRIPSLSTGMELYQDIFMKCLSLNSADIAQDHRWHWAYLCGKQIQGKKAYPSQGQKYGPKSALVSKMLEHRLLLCMLLRKIFYFICKTNSSYYHLLMIDIII